MPCELDPPQKFRTACPSGWLAVACLLASLARARVVPGWLAGGRAACLLSWRRGWASQAHMLMLAHVVASSQSESIVLCGFLVVYVAMPAPRPSSQAADLRWGAFRASDRHLVHLSQGCDEGCGEDCRLSASLPLAAGHRVAVWGRTCGGRHSEYMYLPLGSALHVG